MVLGSLQCRGVLLVWHMVGQGPAVLAAGAGRVGCFFWFWFHWWAYSIGRHPSYIVRLSTFSNMFSLEATRPVEATFYVDALWVGGTKAPSNGHGHMTKMASMPIYSKNLKKSSSPEPKGWWPWNLVCSIGYSSTTKFLQMMTLGWPWPILWQGQIWSLMLLYGKKVKQWIFQKLLSSMIWN